MEGERDKPELRKEAFFERPGWVFVFLSIIVIIATAWIWRSEMRETSREVGVLVDQQLSVFDIDLGSTVDAIKNVTYLSDVSASTSLFQNSVRAIVAGDENIRSVRVLDAAGNELFGIGTLFAEGLVGPISSQLENQFLAYEEGFVDQLRSLSEGGVVVSDFTVMSAEDKSLPTILLGTGLFYPSGERAGFVVLEVVAENVLQNMRQIEKEDAALLFLVSSEGRWVYDSRASDEWLPLKNDEQARWITDDYPDVWRAMNSSKNGSIAADGLWIFREFSIADTEDTNPPKYIDPGASEGSGVRSEPFFVLKKLDGGPSWGEVLSAWIPLVVLYVLALAVMLPAIFRSRRARRASERAALQLGEANLRTRLAMDAARISEWRIDLDSGRIETDSRTEKLLLRSADAPVRTVDEWEMIIHPQERRRVLDQLEPLWTRGAGSFNIRHRMKRGDHSWGWFQFRGGVRDEGSGRNKVILGAYLDITEPMRQGAELDRLVMATRQTLAGIAILDKEGRLEWSNTAFGEMPGRSGIDIDGKPITALLDLKGEDAEQDRQSIQDSILRGDEFSLVVTRVPEGGEISWTRVVGNPVLGDDGIPTHYVVVESDISREKKAEADLLRSEKLLTESQRLAGIGSWEIDVEEGSVFWSDQIFQILGISTDVTPNMEKILGLLDEADRDVLRKDLSLASKEGNGFSHEFSFETSSGERRWVLVTGMALRAAEVTSKVFGVIQDISVRKRSEAALIESRKEEEVLNDQMAAALNKAHAAEKKAQEASEAKSSFLSMISHEIRNPINGVIGMAEILKETSLDETQKSYLDAIYSSGSTVVMLLDDILDFNRLEHGRIEFEERSFPLEAVIEESVLVFSPKIEQKGLDLGICVDPAVPGTVTGDETRVKQILFNLIGNAVKFTERGSISIEVELRERRPNDRCLLQVSVSDTGRGIEKDRHERIFKPFSQIDPSITRKFGGSGLGLAISRELAMRMGGDLEFESEKGEGSTFRAVLPFPATFEKHKPKKLFKDKAYGLFSLEARGKQLQSALKPLGMTVTIRDSVSAAVDVLKDADAGDWIFIDYAIAGDEQVLSTIRERAGDLPKVFVVGWLSQKEILPFEGRWISLPLTRKRVVESLEGSDEKKAAKTSKVKKTSDSIDAGGEGPAKIKILVAEDNAVNQKVIRLLLKRKGYECVVVENGALAVEEVKAKQFDLLLMDIQMPVMDGFEASRKIVKEIPEERRPRIVALTAGATRDSREDSKKAGMSGYLTKPIQSGALRDEIEATIQFINDRGES